MPHQPIEAIRLLPPEEVAGFYRGSVVKYTLRSVVSGVPGKGGLADLKKARQYLDWLIDLTERDSA